MSLIRICARLKHTKLEVAAEGAVEEGEVSHGRDAVSCKALPSLVLSVEMLSKTAPFLAVCLTVQAHTIFLEGQMGSDFYVVVRGAVVLEGTSRKTGAVVEVGTAERVSS